jgi:hypothetical protein
MISLAARWFVVCGVLLLSLTSAAALELEVGTRFPAEPNERIVVKNDGGVSNATDSFGFGEVCYVNEHLKTWFVVLRIVGDQVLVEFECIPTVFGRSCPNGQRPICRCLKRERASMRMRRKPTPNSGNRCGDPCHRLKS